MLIQLKLAGILLRPEGNVMDSQVNNQPGRGNNV